MERFIDNLDCLIDLHIHLDGALSLNNCKALAKLQNISLNLSDEELLEKIRVSPNCHDLNEFLEKFAFPCSLIQTKEAITLAVSNLLHELKEQGVMYAEIRFAPQLSTLKGLTQTEVVEAAIEGLDNTIPANLILCCMRGIDNKEANLETVRVAAKCLNKGVCALDLAGAEGIFKTELFGEEFSLARELGVPFTIHAGEASGAESVRCAISYGASRIGHGVRSVESEEILFLLLLSGIPLELCPTSNIQTCIFKDLSEYPLRKLMDMGIIVTINTDDPAIEGTTLKDEYKKLIKEFSLSKDEVKKLLFNSISSAYAFQEIKEELINKLEKSFA